MDFGSSDVTNVLVFLQIAAVDDLIKEKTQEKENLMKQPRRMCGLQPAIKDPEVIGKVSRGSHRLLSGSPRHRGNRENDQNTGNFACSRCKFLILKNKDIAIIDAKNYFFPPSTPNVSAKSAWHRKQSLNTEHGTGKFCTWTGKTQGN